MGPGHLEGNPQEQKPRDDRRNGLVHRSEALYSFLFAYVHIPPVCAGSESDNLLRTRGLIFALIALLATSIGTTLYLVNHPLRPKPAGSVEVGTKEPEQVLSPSELFGSSPSPKGVSDTAGPKTDLPQNAEESKGAGPEVLATPVASRVVYPEWKSADFQVREARPVTDEGHYSLPKWSPVGLDIAFTVDNESAVYIAGSLPGGAVRKLIEGAGVGKEFRWNLDGMSLRVKAPDAQFDDVLVTGERYAAPAISQRVVERDDCIYFYPLGGGLSAKPVLVSGPEDRFSDPVLSPDETRIVYRGSETGLYIATVDGNQTLWVGDGVNPSWLPDSSGIVYDLPISDGRSMVGGDLWIATADGLYRANLTQTNGIVEADANVAPDGERIAFVASGRIYVGKLVKPISGTTPPPTPKEQP